MKIAVIFLLSAISLSAQSSLKLTLDECIEYAQTVSPAAIAAKSSYRSRMLEYKSFRAGFYPQLTMSAAGPGVVREINQVVQPDGSVQYLPQSQLFSNASLSINQKIPWTGGQLFLSSGLSRIDVLERNEYSLWRTSPLQLTYVQPIFRFNSMKWDRDIEYLRNEQSDNVYNSDMEQIAINATREFFTLYMAGMSVRNAEVNVSINDTLFTLSKGRYEVGRIAENDLLQSELALLNSQNELESARLDYLEAEENLKILLGINKSIKLEIIPPLDIEEIDIPLERALSQAVENNPDFTGYEIQTLQAERDIEIAESNYGLSADLSASFGLNQSNEEIGLAYESLLDQQRVNVTLSLPIFNWGQGDAEIESAIEAQKQAENSIKENKDRLETRIKYELLRFEQLQKQVDLSQRADNIGQKRFEVAKNRYLIGKIDLNTFFIAQNEKDSAFRNYVATLRDYWIAYFNIRRLTLFDFRTNSKINYPL
jgi:outer membrane protein TolC